MKKTILTSLAGLALVLAGCTQQAPTTNQNINPPTADINQNVNQPVVNQNQNTNQPIDQTADWQTYQSQKYKYEIKYPDNFKIEETQSDNKIFVNLWTTDEYSKYKNGVTYASPYLWIEVDSLGGISVESWIKNKGYNWNLEKTAYYFGDIKYLKTHEEGQGSGAYLFITTNDNEVIIIGSINDNGNNETFKKILSSLIFKK